MDFSGVDETKAPEGENQEFHFFYNREERLKNAPQIVRDYYDGKMNPKKGLFRVLFATKSNRFLFISIFIFAAFIFMYSFISGRMSQKFLGTETELTAFSFEGDVYASLKLSSYPEERKNSVQVPVTVLFTAWDVSTLAQDKRELTETFTGNELFIRTKFTDYDIIKVTAEVTSPSEKKEFSVPVQRR